MIWQGISGQGVLQTALPASGGLYNQTNEGSGHECTEGLHAAPCANDQYMKMLGILDP